MKYLRLILLILCMALTPTLADAKTAMIFATGRAGGATGDLDSVECEDIKGDNTNRAIATGDLCVIGTSTRELYLYRYLSTGTDSEADPDIIVPDDRADCSNQGQWELFKAINVGASATPQSTLRDSDAIAFPAPVAGSWSVNLTDTSDGTEDADVYWKQIINGVLTTFLLADADGKLDWQARTLTNIADPTADDDVGDRAYNDNRYELNLTNPVTSDGASTVEGQIPQFTSTNNQLQDSLDLVLVVGDPGSDTNLVSEQGIREGLNTKAASGANSDITSLAGLTTPLSVAQGGTGRATSTTAYGLLAAGTTATGAHQTLSAGATTEILVGGGASALPVWTTATGTGAPVRAGSPALTGDPTAPTASANDNDTSIATTAHVQTELTAYNSDSVTLTGKTIDADDNVIQDMPYDIAWSLVDPADADIHYVRLQRAVTLSSCGCIVDPEGTGESVVLDIQECDSNGDTCATILSSTITCANTPTAGTISDSALAASGFLKIDIGAVTGTVKTLSIYGVGKESY